MPAASGEDRRVKPHVAQGFAGGGAGACGVRPARQKAVAHVGLHRAGKQIRGLQQQRDLPALSEIARVGRLTVEEDPPLVRRFQQGEQAQERGLAAPVAPGDVDDTKETRPYKAT